MTAGKGDHSYSRIGHQPIANCRATSYNDIQHTSGKSRILSNSAILNAVNGVVVAGLRTIEFPAAIAGTTLLTTRFNGKLNGEMVPKIPIGVRIKNPIRFSELGLASIGIVSP